MFIFNVTCNTCMQLIFVAVNMKSSSSDSSYGEEERERKLLLRGLVPVRQSANHKGL